MHRRPPPGESTSSWPPSPPIGPFVHLPIVLLRSQRLRERAGLQDLPVPHDLLSLPPGPAMAAPTTNDWAAALNAKADPLSRQVLARMRRSGHDEGEIELAFLERRAPVTRTALARPLPSR